MMDYKNLFLEECNRCDTLYAIIQMMSSMIDNGGSIFKGKKIAIYGIGMMGNALFCLLRKMSIDVVFAIDRRGGINWNDINVYYPEQKLPDADLIIITVDSHYLEFEKNIFSKGVAYMSINEFVEELCNCPYEY